MHMHAVNFFFKNTAAPEIYTATRNKRSFSGSAPASFPVYKLCWGGDLPVGPDRPVYVIEIERWNHVGELDVGFPEGIDRPDVAPVSLRLGIALHTGLAERMRNRRAVLND